MLRTASTTNSRVTPQTRPLDPRVGMTTLTSGRSVTSPTHPITALMGGEFGISVDPRTRTVFGDSADTRLERPRLVVAAGHTGRRLAPVVQHLRDVDELLAEFGESKEQVVILGAVEPESEPADLIEDPSPNHDHVGDVVLVPESLGREVRLEEGHAPACRPGEADRGRCTPRSRSRPSAATIEASASGARTSSWSSSATNSPEAAANPSLVAAAIPPDSLRVTTVTRWSRSAAAASISPISELLDPSSTRTCSQSAVVCPSTDARQASRCAGTGSWTAVTTVTAGIRTRGPVRRGWPGQRCR